jgi:hypothetical protein
MGLGLGGVIRLQPCVSLSDDGAGNVGNGISDGFGSGGLGIFSNPSWKHTADTKPFYGVKGVDYVYFPVWLGRDNVIEILLTEHATAIQIENSISRITLTLGDVVIDSETSPDAFDITQKDSSGNHILRLLLGDESLVVGNYLAKLTIYDADNTSGVVMADDDSVNPLPIEVKAN